MAFGAWGTYQILISRENFSPAHGPPDFPPLHLLRSRSVRTPNFISRQRFGLRSIF